jgi:hypothetical protein
MNEVPAIRAVRALAAIGAVVAAAGCGDLLDVASRNYRGPVPSSSAVIGERVIVRWIGHQVEGRVFVIVERVRFADAGDPHNIDRVVKIATTQATEGFVAALGVQTGDLLTISTEFSGFAEGAGSYGVPDWPGHRAMEYPIGLHLLVDVARIP